MQLPFGHVDPGSGIPELFAIFSVGKSGILVVLVGDCTESDFFITAIADIRSFIEPAATFLFKVRAGLVAGRAGSTLDTAKKDFPTGIGLPAMIAVKAEVFGIIKCAFVIPVGKSVSPYLF